jgi:hypothetical protein
MNTYMQKLLIFVIDVDLFGYLPIILSFKAQAEEWRESLRNLG